MKAFIHVANALAQIASALQEIKQIVLWGIKIQQNGKNYLHIW